MDKRYTSTFTAVITFVNDLWEVFGNPKKASPLALYRRLIEHMKISDAEPINKVLSGFRQFLVKYEDAIMNDNLDSIPRGTTIKYGDSKTVYIDIQRFIYQTQTDKETREAIRQHLVTISAILDPDRRKLEELDRKLEELNIDVNSKEGEFISNIMHKAKNSMESVDTENPAQAIMGLFESGIIQEMVVGLQQGSGEGQMDLNKLLGSMQSALSSIMPPPEQSNDNNNFEVFSQKSIEEVRDEEVD